MTNEGIKKTNFYQLKEMRGEFTLFIAKHCEVGAFCFNFIDMAIKVGNEAPLRETREGKTTKKLT